MTENLRGHNHGESFTYKQPKFVGENFSVENLALMFLHITASNQDIHTLLAVKTASRLSDSRLLCFGTI